jgi:hypothetical protein
MKVTERWPLCKQTGLPVKSFVRENKHFRSDILNHLFYESNFCSMNSSQGFSDRALQSKLSDIDSKVNLSVNILKKIQTYSSDSPSDHANSKWFLVR